MSGEQHFEAGVIRVVVSGDHHVMRAALRSLIDGTAGLLTVGDCENRPEALTAARSLSPSLFLMDLDLRTCCNGNLERFGELLRVVTGTPVLILTADDECHAAQFALERGAVGFVFKHRPPEVLWRAIRAAAAGETWLEQSTMAAVFRPAPPAKKSNGNSHELTHREREIIGLVSLGLQNRAVAERLFISETTVRHHLTSIFDKLDVANRLELMRYMFEREESAAGAR